MGKAIWGTSGGFQGKNGANIGRWVDGQNIVGPLPHPSQKPPTTAQLNQRAKFGLVTSWLRLIKGIIRTGFNVHKEKVSPWSTAVAYNLRHAVLGAGPNYTIDYPNVLFCKGELSIPTEVMVTSLPDSELKFDWDTIFNVGFGDGTDQVSIVVYNPSRNLFTMQNAAATRAAGTYTLKMPASFAGDQVQCYLSLLSADGKTASDSVYVGMVTVL